MLLFLSLWDAPHNSYSALKELQLLNSDTFYQVQEAADCLGADCVPRYVDVKEMNRVDVETMLCQSKQVNSFI